MRYDAVRILSNFEIAENVFRMTLPYPFDPGAGRFFMLQKPEAATLLPRPVSVCDYDNGVLTFVYQVVGKGTGALSRMSAGNLLHLTGPLGNGFEDIALPETGSVSLVGGGAGVAPMLLTAKKLKEKGVSVTAVCGYRDEPFLTDEIGGIADELLIATESGRFGVKGYVTEIFEPEKYGAVYCCGPEPMLKAVTGLCAEKNTPVYVSLERKMACGIGACLVCACAGKDGKNRRVCKDGPVFRGEDVCFDA